jgi:hypothetical protein
MLVGELRPETTVLTERAGSVIEGAGDCASTVVVRLALLLLKSGSVSSLLTETVLVMVPAVVGLRAILMTMLVPAPRLPRLQVRVGPVTLQIPGAVKVILGDIISVKITFVALAGPLFETTIR